MASSRKKNNTLPARRTDTEGKWSDLATVGDVRRCLRWTLLGVATDTLDTKKAGVMANICGYLLKSLELEMLSDRLAEIERRLDHAEPAQGVLSYDASNQTQPH